MRRVLLAAALGLGLLTTAAPAANACAWEYCPGTSVVCATYGCPVYCAHSPVDIPVLGAWVCVL